LRISINFDKITKPLEKALAEWGGADEEEGETEDDPVPKKSLSEKKKKKLLDAQSWERDAGLLETATLLRRELGGDIFLDHNVFREMVDGALEKLGRKLSSSELKMLLRAMSWRDENAPPVLAKLHKRGRAEPDPLRGLYEVEQGGKSVVVEYEPDTDLRDTEQVPLLEEGGVEAFIRREVLPYTPDAWIDEKKTKVGYEISFTRHFYKPQPLRSLEEVRADILAAEREAEGLLEELLGRRSPYERPQNSHLTG
jgi:type I restriction enzyme M protein